MNCSAVRSCPENTWPAPHYGRRDERWQIASDRRLHRFPPLPPSAIVESDPLVSVIIPTHNRLSMVSRAVESALDQTYGRLEVIVVDEGSNDGTFDRLKRHPDSRMQIIRTDHRGVSAARNAGLSKAAGTFVAFLDSDDVFHRRKLEICVRHLLRYPELAFVHTFWADQAGEEGERTIVRPHAKGDVRHDLFMFTPIEIYTVVARKDALEAAGLFDTEMRLAEDYDLLCRLALLGAAGLIEQPLTDKLIHAGGTRQTPDLVLAAQLRVLEHRHPRDQDLGVAPLETYMANAYSYAALRHLLRARPDWAASSLFEAIKLSRRPAGRGPLAGSSADDTGRYSEQP